MASHIEPPLAEKELADWFMDIVQPIFYERLVGRVSASFSDFVAAGIKVELGLKNGKMSSVAGTSNNNNAKKFPEYFMKKRKERRMLCRPFEEGVNHGESNNDNSLNNNQHTLCIQQAPIYQPAQVAPAYQQVLADPAYQQPKAQAPRQNTPTRNKRQGVKPPFSPIPMTYTELYPYLLQKGLVVPRPLGPPPDPLPTWYNHMLISLSMMVHLGMI
ncbi:hypothetical protein KIW84_055010 [Lathyrus oleraceus]|uniref:Uncharacterized protein n=1 Tax=Pisum sativum TaxID=3888 RepID=A0A9D4WX54_PEA|nr:hypothetical protein KIW84_055010 [Pisum sativum]